MTQQAEDKFAHLLQPIRDLAGNWNIDIAHELEDYLEVLESVTFSFEGGPSLNFAEAALVIQGSACVYSKKVEYLHSLVYQALDFVAESKKGGGAAGAAKDAAAGGGGDDEFEDEEQFLSLDDLLEEGGAIDLDGEEVFQLGAPIRPPATLLALEDSGQGDGESGNYRIASCSMHHSGALLLESRDGEQLNEQLLPVSSHTAGPKPHWAPAGMESDSAPRDSAAADDGYGDDGGGYDDGYDDYPAAEPAAEDGEGWARQETQPPQQQQPAADVFDPYKPLDPNSRGTLAQKPFKKASKVAQRAPKIRQAVRPSPALTIESLLTMMAPGSSATLFPEFSYAIKEEAQPSTKGASRATSARSTYTAAQMASAFSAEDAFGGAGPAEDAADDGGHADFYDDGYAPSDNDDGYAPAGDFEMPDYDGVPRAAADWGPDQATDLASGELTYEELCRAHIEAFISAAAAAEIQTDLASRVAGWRSKMGPMLEEEDARPEFDIHEYGQLFLDRLANLSCDDPAPAAPAAPEGQFNFGQVLRGAGTKYEVSRSFSSMLQLINNGNVRITKLGGSNEQFTLLLQDRMLPHTNMAAKLGFAEEKQGMEATAGAGASADGDLLENFQWVQQQAAAAKPVQQQAAAAKPVQPARAKAGAKAKRRKA